jgi:diaminohydroxyphosphoribosylaminopyrimidine deaminase / 5-amino-6-(5-phosphoribosylamino)uracil reductase
VTSGDESFMLRALELAQRGWGQVAPNPMVGAVLVRDGTIVGEGWHAAYGMPHAEVEAITAAGERARGATLYVTLEPCTHKGKTGPCTEAILAAGIRRVVFASHDPNSEAAGGGEALWNAGVEVRSGVEDAAARSLNAPFFHAFDASAPLRPWTELKLAVSLDGRIADLTGRSTWITGDASRAEVHRLRAGHDGVAVGIGTVLADDPLLTARGGIKPRRPPVRIVFDRQLRLPLTSRLVQSAPDVPVWVCCAPGAPAQARADLEEAGVQIHVAGDLGSALAVLARAGIRSLFCEGGAGLASAMLAEELVDRLTLFYAPLLLGVQGIDPFRGVPSFALDQTRRWTTVRAARFGLDAMISVER